MKKLVVVVLILASLTAWFVFRGNDTPEIRKPTKGSAIIAFGDSLVEGLGSSGGNDFVSVLGRRAGTDIINAGLSGDTTSTALQRLETDVLNRNPKVVIVLLGGNDLLSRASKQKVFSNLEQIIDRIYATGAGVVLVGIKGGIFTDEYGKEYENLARKKQTAFVPDILKDIYGNNGLMYDQIHPNDAGYAIMAERIEPYLKLILE